MVAAALGEGFSVLQATLQLLKAYDMTIQASISATYARTALNIRIRDRILS